MISLTPAWPEPTTQRRLAASLSIVLALLLAWILARIFWLVFSPAQTPQSVQVPQAGQPLRGTPRIELDQYHLFGEFLENATVAAFHDAPETALKLELRGIVSSADPEAGFAIIVASGRQAVYGIGEVVPGGAEVRGIYPDRVVLFYTGRYETLRLPIGKAGDPDAPELAHGKSTIGTAVPLSVNIADGQDKLLLNLDTSTRYSLIPVAGGGYRLFLSRDAQQLVDMGLHNGDVIRSANGIPLNSQRDVERVFAKVLSGESLTLLIERNGAQLTLTPDIEQMMAGAR